MSLFEGVVKSSQSGTLSQNNIWFFFLIEIVILKSNFAKKILPHRRYNIFFRIYRIIHNPINIEYQ